MSVVASQSEPPTILPANTAQQIAKLNIQRSDLTIRVTPCGSLFRESVTDHGVYHVDVHMGQKRTSVSLWPLCASCAVKSETIDATTDHDIVQPLTIRLLGFNFFGGRILPLVTVPKSRLLAR